MTCQTCGKELPGNHPFCPFCGPAVEAAGRTVSVGETAAAAAPARTSDVVTGQPAARFLPGTVIAERYRIVAQIGRGGMGEVYRADDLRLGQTVALKFLPESLTHDATALARLNREVRMARQVSHPNVCRVFDVGEADGVPFISMEFVDGEDLASLLQRIGRLPQDKAVQVAHQLCAGLAEAHAFGVLHRDLKPANIMLDGRGNVRITDFGLATTTEELGGEAGRAGTPAYMAPEQLAGHEATTQSDLYSLGLVLYELFTGKEAYPGTTIAEMLAQRQKGAPAKLSAVVKGLDPAIERVIFQCLDRDAHNRPRSALVVAAALPGGDPLAAVIAAGETPSPEMVAAATDEPLVSVGRLWLIVAAIIAGIVLIGFLVQTGSVLTLAPVEKSPDVMAEHARQLLHRLGYVTPPADSAYWYEEDSAYVRYFENRKPTKGVAEQWSSAVPTPMRFIYRQSPRKLWARTDNGTLQVTATEPPDDTSGMITVVLDAAGRLQSFSAVVPQLESADTVASPADWDPLLSAAGIDQNTLTEVTPKWLPRTGFDTRAAWSGTLGGQPVHIVAAAYRGTPVYFWVVAPWTPRERADTRPVLARRVVDIALGILLLLTIVGAAFLTRRNLRLGRGDTKGALRLSVVMFASAFGVWAFAARHVADSAEISNLLQGSMYAAAAALYVYFAYLAVEPFVRRGWPSMLISSTRVLAGRFADPRVGRDLLAGCVAGVLSTSIVIGEYALPVWFNVPGAPYYPRYDDAIRGFSGSFAIVLLSLEQALGMLFITVVGLLLVRLIARRQRIMLLLWLMLFAPLFLTGTRTLIAGPAAVVIAAIYVFVLFRFGMLAAAALEFTSTF